MDVLKWSLFNSKSASELTLVQDSHGKETFTASQSHCVFVCVVDRAIKNILYIDSSTVCSLSHFGESANTSDDKQQPISLHTYFWTLWQYILHFISAQTSLSQNVRISSPVYNRHVCRCAVTTGYGPEPTGQRVSLVGLSEKLKHWLQLREKEMSHRKFCGCVMLLIHTHSIYIYRVRLQVKLFCRDVVCRQTSIILN